ncbi:hypothetical protein IMX26_16740 [Clostridium sp. 'deep sea']|uniref:hypothetical protein n=1 Tax=Clostridium sp. 'deep sea' TaxID=2779445 RepID=UPI0018967D14|nr:hypothetical protein [Clostridium sp. 'deep sea']QOR35082.1 hypothetical protein IMX26_16740 [Clostridium sp. 'deep sea']
MNIIKKGFNMLLTILAVITILIGGLIITIIQVLRSVLKKLSRSKHKPQIYKCKSSRLVQKV